MNPKMLFPQPKPYRLYSGSAAKTRKAPDELRTSVVAVRADAAPSGPNMSIIYSCADVVMIRTPVPIKTVPRIGKIQGIPALADQPNQKIPIGQAGPTKIINSRRRSGPSSFFNNLSLNLADIPRPMTHPNPRPRYASPDIPVLQW